MKTFFCANTVNPKNHILTMKTTLFPKVLFLTLALILINFTSCQKDAIAPTTENSTLINSEQVFAVEDIVSLGDMGRPVSSIQTRGDLPDIDDVPVVTSGIIINCGGTPYECAIERLETQRFINAIKVGQRLGVYDNLALSSSTSKYNCYRHYSDIGVRDFCGYIGKEKDHALNIKTNGNYRIQLTPKSSTRNLDLFIYKHTVAPNGYIDSTLVSFSTLPAGLTETVHLKEAGYYTIVVDEKVSNPTGSDYILSVSTNTPVITVPILRSDNTLIYQFIQNPASATKSRQLIAWNFKRKIGGVMTDLGNYSPFSTFRFTCSTCDYLVSPVYYNTNTGLNEEGTATVIRP